MPGGGAHPSRLIRSIVPPLPCMRSAARLRPLALRTLQIAVISTAVGLFLFLPFAGRFLHAEDPLQRADLIIVLAGTRVERWLEAVDLYKEGWAPRIAVSPGPVDPVETELHARGVRYPREGELARDAIIASGVPPDVVTLLPNGVDNTAAEAAALFRASAGAPIRRVIVVTSPYHTRRAGFAFRRAFANTSVHVVMRASRYSDADPARWWTRRADVRFIMSELPKFAAYVAGLAD
jgi:uncharacterized SAM-binding protein YcdF (DUF218 family)